MFRRFGYFGEKTDPRYGGLAELSSIYIASMDERGNKNITEDEKARMRRHVGDCSLHSLSVFSVQNPLFPLSESTLSLYGRLAYDMLSNYSGQDHNLAEKRNLFYVLAQEYDRCRQAIQSAVDDIKIAVGIHQSPDLFGFDDDKFSELMYDLITRSKDSG